MFKALKERADNFYMFKHSDVKLVLNKQDLLPSDLDFDFTVTNNSNSDLTASVSIYNLEVDKINHLQVVCNGAVAFEVEDTKKNINNIDVSIKTNEVSIVTSLSAKYSNIKIPNILEKGQKITIGGITLEATKDYIFSSKDSENAKLKVILNNQGIGGFAVNVDEFLLLNEKLVKFTINPHDLLLLQALESFAGEELTLISLYSPFLAAGKNLNYIPKNTKTAKNYTITSVITGYSCNSGLIQTIQAKTGDRLKHFLNFGDKKEGK